MNIFAQRYTPVMFSDILVQGAGSPESDGVYKWYGYFNGRPVWWLDGAVGSDPEAGPSIYYLGGSWSNAIPGLGSQYRSSDSDFPWNASWFEDAGNLPVPTVTAVNPLMVPQGILVVGHQYKTLNELGLTAEKIGNANAIMFSSSPKLMAAENKNGFWYEWNFNAGYDAGGFYAGNNKGEGYMSTPLIIDGVKAFQNVKLASQHEPMEIYYQLLTGNT